jgi:hypothetical protein
MKGGNIEMCGVQSSDSSQYGHCCLTESDTVLIGTNVSEETCYISFRVQTPTLKMEAADSSEPFVDIPGYRTARRHIPQYNNFYIKL